MNLSGQWIDKVHRRQPLGQLILDLDSSVSETYGKQEGTAYRPKVFYHSFQYQAKSWQHPRRVVAKIEWHRGELFPRVGFIVTNLI
jgi:hypothetical protein